MGHADTIAARSFGRKGQQLTIGGVTAGEIASEHGTPLFVYDRELIDRKIDQLHRALGNRFDVYYSIKANPAQAILRCMIGRGLGLEVASSGELIQALRAGCRPERVLFAGPGKTRAELEFALANDVGEFHVESFEEIKTLGSLAQQHGSLARVALRVNPAGEAQGGAMRMGGKPSVFGIDEESLDDAVDRIRNESGLEFCGVHLFTGTQILDHAALLRQYSKCLDIARRAAERAGAPVQTIDFGGGLGIPMYAREEELDLEALGAGLMPLVDDARRHPSLKNARLLLEPGRFLVGECGLYITRVIGVKRSRGKTFVIVDGGMHHHLAASGNLGQVIKRNFPILMLTRLGEKPSITADVVGPLCTPLDVLAREEELPEPEPGDLIGVLQSGAYARSASPLGFLSHPTPPEVLVVESRAVLIRRRGSPEDFLDGQVETGHDDAGQG